MLSEMLGILLVCKAMTAKKASRGGGSGIGKGGGGSGGSNVMVETSRRYAAMF